MQDSVAGGPSYVDVLDELDPCLSVGHRVMYDREVQFEIRVQQGDEPPEGAGTFESLRVKLLQLGDDEVLWPPKSIYNWIDAARDPRTAQAARRTPLRFPASQDPAGVRIECTSENDLYFHYTHTMDEAGFLGMQEEQQLTIPMCDYLPVLARMLNTCIASPELHLGLFVLRSAGRARLDFYQNLQYKFIELLSVPFVESDEETVRRSITHRYQRLKSRLAITQARLLDFTAVVKVKNPSLVLQMHRGDEPCSPGSAFGRSIGR